MYTSPEPILLASNTRAAARRMACALCHGLIHVGNQIGKVPGCGWAHVDCVIRANRTATEEGTPNDHRL